MLGVLVAGRLVSMELRRNYIIAFDFYLIGSF